MFLVYSGNITLLLLEFAKRSTFVIIKSYTFNTKKTFPMRTFQKISSFKIFPKCFLDAPNIAALRENSANAARILHVGWVVAIPCSSHLLLISIIRQWVELNKIV